MDCPFQSRLSRRVTLRLLAAAGGMAVFEGCAGPPSPGSPAATSAASPVAAGAQAGAPKTGGTLRVTISADPASLDGHLFAAGRFDTTWLVYDRLTEYDVNLQPQPLLAESWDISSDYKRIKLNLRKGVTFHDGRDFTSDDVKWNFLRVRDPAVGAGAFVNQSQWYSSFDTPDKSTIILNSEEPRPLVFDFFERLNMLDRTVMEGPDAKTKANGTGPFKFVEWVQGDHFSSVRNPNYWMSGRPYIDGVRTVILKDQQSAVSQFEAGAIDVFQNMNVIDFLRLKKDPKYSLVQNDVSTGYYCFGINCTWPPLDNKLVRQALNWSINRKRWTDGYFGGTTQPESLEWFPSMPMYEAAKANAYTFDLDRAKALLKQANVSDLALDVLLIPYPETPSLVQIYQADLGSIGITLKIVNMDLAPWLDNVNNRKYHGLYYSPAGISSSVGTELTTSKVWQVGNNNSGFDSPQYQALAAAATTETDPAKLKQVYSQVNDLMLDESFGIPLCSRPPTNLTQAAVHATNNGFGGWWYRDVWVAS
jgi:peptide/nickel transport system substrate-binding protein